MRRFTKLLAVLLSLTLCLSLLPVSAFAEDYDPTDDGWNNKVQTGMDKEDHEPYEPTESYTDPVTGVTDVIMDKVDEEAIRTDAAEELNDILSNENGTGKADEAKEAADEIIADPDDKLEELLGDVEDAVSTGGYEAEAGTEQAEDEEGNAVPDSPDGEAPAPEVTTDETGTPVVTVTPSEDESEEKTPIDEYVGKVETKEDGTTEATGKVGEVAQAAAEAAQAAQDAQAALENATSIAAGTKAPGAEAERAQEDLKEAQQAAFDAYQEANTAAIDAAKSYAEAEAAVNAAQEQLSSLTNAYETYSAGVQKQIDEAQKLVKAAQAALDAAAEAKAEAEKQRDYASLYNTLAQAISGNYTVSEEELAAPEAPAAPEELGEDATEEERAQYQEALEQYAKDQEKYEYELLLYNAEKAKKDLAEEEPLEAPVAPVKVSDPMELWGYNWAPNGGGIPQKPDGEPEKPEKGRFETDWYYEHVTLKKYYDDLAAYQSKKEYQWWVQYEEDCEEYSQYLEQKKAYDEASAEYGKQLFARAEKERAILLAALAQTTRTAEKYGDASNTEQLENSLLELVKNGTIANNSHANAPYMEFYYDWTHTEVKDGKTKEQLYQEQLDKVKQMELEKNIEPTEQDPNGYDVISGTDVLYKVYFYTLQDGVNGKVTSLGDGTYSKYVSQVKEGLKQYLEAEEFLKKVEKKEAAEFQFGDAKITASDDKLMIEGSIVKDFWDNDLFKEPLTKENYKNHAFVRQYLYEHNMSADFITWDDVYEEFCAQVQIQMGNQLDNAYEKIYGHEKNLLGGDKLSVYEQLKLIDPSKIDIAHVGSQKEFETFMNYMGLLEYELQFRSQNIKYGARWEQFKDTTSNEDVVDLLLSGGAFGIEKLKGMLSDANDQIEANPNDENLKANKAELEMILALLEKGQIGEGEAGEELGQILDQYSALYILHQRALSAMSAEELLNLEYSQQTEMMTGEITLIIREIIQHANAKKEAAADAAKTAKAATDAYDAAAKKVADAAAKLAELKQKLESNKTTYGQAVADAQQQLDEAKAELEAAEANRDAALAAQQAAEADYVEAMQLAITVATVVDPSTPDPENPENPDTPDDYDLGDTDDDDDDDDDAEDTDVTIEDEAVPLAAGPVTRAQFVDYLWRHEGSPEADAPTFPDVPADHEFAQAIGWAQAAGLVSGYEDGTFQPDELVTVKMVRTILDRFDRAFGKSVVKAAALTTLTGEDGEAVLNCDEVLAEFFGEEVVPAEDEAEIVA